MLCVVISKLLCDTAAAVSVRQLLLELVHKLSSDEKTHTLEQYIYHSTRWLQNWRKRRPRMLKNLLPSNLPLPECSLDPIWFYDPILNQWHYPCSESSLDLSLFHLFSYPNQFTRILHPRSAVLAKPSNVNYNSTFPVRCPQCNRVCNQETRPMTVRNQLSTSCCLIGQ